MTSVWAYLTGAKGPSGFGSATTAEEVAQAYPDQCKDKVVLVTGAASGIGLEAARVLAKHGATVYVHARSAARAEEAMQSIRQSVPSAKLKPFVAELGSLKSIKTAVDKFLADNVPLNILINNAGVMALPLTYTEDGLESQWGTNHLAHYYLTHLLLDKLKASAPARVVNLSSYAHAFAPSAGIVFDNLDAKKSYSPWARYGESKLSNILFTRALHARQIPGVTFYSLHPGSIFTNLYKGPGAGLTKKVSGWPFAKSIPQGAANTLFCALSDKAVPGEYHTDCNVDMKGAHKHFRDTDLANKLMEVSENIVREKTAAF